MVWDVGVGSFLGCTIKMLPFLIRMVSPQASSAMWDSSNAMLMFFSFQLLEAKLLHFFYILQTILFSH